MALLASGCCLAGQCLLSGVVWGGVSGLGGAAVVGSMAGFVGGWSTVCAPAGRERQQGGVYGLLCVLSIMAPVGLQAKGFGGFGGGSRGQIGGQGSWKVSGMLMSLVPTVVLRRLTAAAPACVRWSVPFLASCGRVWMWVE